MPAGAFTSNASCVADVTCGETTGWGVRLEPGREAGKRMLQHRSYAAKLPTSQLFRSLKPAYAQPTIRFSRRPTPYHSIQAALATAPRRAASSDSRRSAQGL